LLFAFIFTFINTSLITLVLYANWKTFAGNDFVISQQASSRISFLQSLSVTYAFFHCKRVIFAISGEESNEASFPKEFDPHWYDTVGLKLFLMMVYYIPLPNVLRFIWAYFSSCWNQRKAKDAIIQLEANNLYLGPEFDMASSYAFALNMIFVIMFYCSGMPLLLFVGVLILFVLFWVDKILRIASLLISKFCSSSNSSETSCLSNRGHETCHEHSSLVRFYPSLHRNLYLHC